MIKFVNNYYRHSCHEIPFEQIDTRPTPLNTILWNAQVQTKKGFRMAYLSLLDEGPIEFSNEFPKNDYLLDPIRDQRVIQQLIKISEGWYLVEEDKDRLIFTDLRFGQIGVDPNDSPFLWRFEIIQDEKGGVQVNRLSGYIENTDYSGTLNSLIRRIGGSK